MITLEEAIKFLRENKVLKSWTDEQIVIGIKRAIQVAALGFSSDSTGKLNGLFFGYWIDNETLHITAMAGKGMLKTYFNYLKKIHPQCKKLEAKRNGVTKIYDLSR